jgi:acetyl-CoA synthetase
MPTIKKKKTKVKKKVTKKVTKKAKVKKKITKEKSSPELVIKTRSEWIKNSLANKKQ